MLENNHASLSPEILKKLEAIFACYPNIEAVILFGSRAMNTNRRNSDIDLCLQGKQLTMKDMLKIENNIDDLLLPWKLDLVLYHTIDNPKLVQHIQNVGQTIYLKQDH